ncbi:MAG: formate transporter FocA [Chloroflexota bacterium]|nr:MAG: formate transporter FocA [Chloroflexota bacterium]
MSDNNLSALDAYAPQEMAQRVENVGVKKATLDWATTLALAILAGAFIALGANFATIVWTDNGLSFGVSRLLGGIVFALGLILVIAGGAELFTGNNLIVMAWASRKVRTRMLFRNWTLVYFGNFIGAFATAFGIYIARQWTFDNYQVGATMLNIANHKVGLDFIPALTLGIFCNALVCLAVWLCFSARTTTDKILSIVPPIAAFVAAGFEHSIANMYFIPLGILLRDDPTVLQAAGKSAAQLTQLTWQGFVFNNLIPVTLGNIIGGAIMVAAVYWFVYLRDSNENRFSLALRALRLQAKPKSGASPQ